MEQSLNITLSFAEFFKEKQVHSNFRSGFLWENEIPL